MSDSDRAAIVALHEGWVRANSDGDIDWLRAHVDPDFVMFNTVGANFLGRDAIVDLWTRLRAMAVEAGSSVGLSEAWDEGYILTEDLGIVHSLSRLRVDFGSGEGAEAGGSLDQVFRCTEVYRRGADGWRMVHYHGSPHTPGLLGGV